MNHDSSSAQRVLFVARGHTANGPVLYSAFLLRSLSFDLRHHQCSVFFDDPAPTEIYTLSLHDALPISSMANGLPSASSSSPANVPSLLNAPILPLPKFPIRILPLKRPNANDARVTPQGELSDPRLAKRRSR